MSKITPSELKYQVEATGSKFFERATMKCFGDTMSNYGVRDVGVIETPSGGKVECWELYRRKPVKHGVQSSAYFNKATFARVHKAIKEAE